ncbi:MAG TPA: shikimate dehydrogenase [Mycobacteriales bacterium]|nr:shikimate dehydrogenase [Mycobacteriales bacterium]
MTVLPRRGAAVLGSPIAHSLSPVLHQAAYDGLGLADWRYTAVECTEAELRSTLERLDASGLAGVSLTMPLKRAVLPMLARTEQLVDDVGAANTVLFGGVAGEWWGANTDVGGMAAALRRLDVVSPKRVCVLGGGATAASALAALREIGAAAAVVVVRRPAGVADLRAAADRLAFAIDVLPWDDASAVVGACDLVISTTPAGATDALPSLVSPRGDAVLFDVVYAPWPTVLAREWLSRGGRVIGGLELLVEQAALQVKLMTGQDPPVEAMRSAGQAALSLRT